jgi:3-(3-hydroxy-phenyl)propionate hydroxylase
MSSKMKMDADIAVIGLGPVGAILTGLLGRRGLRVLAIEKDENVFPLPRAAHIDHTGLRSIQELGCLNDILSSVVRNKRLVLLDADRRPLATVAADQESVSGLPTSVYFYQPEFDRLLRQKAASYPSADVRVGSEMIDIAPDPSGVTLTLKSKEGIKSARVSWVVGCDGAWSQVREMLGIKLESLGFDEKWLVLDLLLKEPHPALPADHVIEVCDPVRPYLTTPISSNRQRFEFMLLPGENPDDVRRPDMISRLLGAWIPQAKYEVERAAVYTFHGLLARQWRFGRVFIAGDAAHQTPPFLGQGMCAGIRDVSNLAWKLALVVQKNAPPALLDTYETERSPHARFVIEAAIRIGRVVCELDAVRATERNRRLRARDSGLESELAFALPLLQPGPLVVEGGGSLFIQPEFEDKHLDDVVGQRFLVLSRTRAALGSSASWWEGQMDALILVLAERPNERLLRWLESQKTDVAVVRPDRYVMGTGKTLDTITLKVQGLLETGACRDVRTPSDTVLSAS